MILLLVLAMYMEAGVMVSLEIEPTKYVFKFIVEQGKIDLAPPLTIARVLRPRSKAFSKARSSEQL